MFDSLPICRVCLKTSLEYIDFDTPFEVEDANIKTIDNGLTYLDCFQACTRIEIDFDENYPQSLCSSCGLELKIAFEFLQKAEIADKTLRELSANTKVEKFDDEDEVKCFLPHELHPHNDEESPRKHEKPNDSQLEDEKTYVCTVCGEQFFSQMVLNLHVNRLHTNNATDEQINATVDKVECQICDVILSIDSLETHMQMHEDESNFEENNEDKTIYEEVVVDEAEEVEFEMLDMTNVSVEEEEQDDLTNINDSQDDGTNPENYEPVDEDEEEIISQVKNETTRSDADGEEAEDDVHAEDDNEADEDLEFNVIAKIITEQEKKKQRIRKPKSKQCEICSKHVRLSAFNAHMNVHNGVRQFPCEYCFQSYFSNRSLQKHVRANHADSLNSCCSICKEKVEGQDMKAHIDEKHSHMVKCTECDHSCPELKMKDHKKRKHTESKDFLCNVCSKTFTRMGTLTEHLKTHENDRRNKSYTCDICGKISTSLNCAKVHRQIHEESRPTYSCDDCGKIYLSSSSLNQHRRWHTGKAFKCVQCPKMFVQRAEYRIHLRFHTRDFPHQCEMCGKEFNAKGHLNSHLKMHLGWKLKCQVCGKLFATRTAYSGHMFKHSEMPYKCLKCTRGYPTKSKLRYHLKTSHSLDMTIDEISELYVKQPTVTKREKLEWIKVDSNEKESS